MLFKFYSRFEENEDPNVRSIKRGERVGLLKRPTFWAKEGQHVFEIKKREAPKLKKQRTALNWEDAAVETKTRYIFSIHYLRIFSKK